MVETDLLQAIKSFLINQTNLGLNSSTCLISLGPQFPPKIPRGGRFLVRICPNRSDFPIDEQDSQQLAERMVITIVPYVRIDLDPADSAEAQLLDNTRGLYLAKEEIIRCLAGRMIFDQTGKPLLRDHLRVSFCGEPDYDQENRIAWLTIDFQAVFDRW